MGIYGCGNGYGYGYGLGMLLQGTFTLGTPIAGVANPSYKVCWGHAPTTLQDFNVELDADAELFGPDTGDILSCILGLPCAATVSGYGLSSTNGIVAIAGGQCGDANAVLTLETWGYEAPTSVTVDSDGLSLRCF